MRVSGFVVGVGVALGLLCAYVGVAAGRCDVVMLDAAICSSACEIPDMEEISTLQLTGTKSWSV